MKTDWRDYLYSSITLSLATLACLATGYTADMLLQNALPSFHALASALIALLSFGLSCAVQARILLKMHRLTPGTYSMSEQVFTVWKLYSVLYYFGCGALKPFTIMFFRPLIQQIFGAQIGRDIALGGILVDPHLISIGNGAIIGEGSILAAHAITSGRIILAPIVIAPGATVGVNAVVMPGTTIHAGAILLAGAVATPNTTIPANEVWGGVPARPLPIRQQ